ncbi:hypothetical protein AXF42_Ash017113 [Apostasia shenzhenica]|uniref:UDENN domain-containing protein n=1 Tax=Apostasia shenzhenica TaxID=1088818 RepID=A0A2H9ZV60_9ASPA|nr:hypothetical protein AXF42_Ash017113 [Apostasia shenzhenica]
MRMDLSVMSMDRSEDSESPASGASFFLQTIEEFAKVVGSSGSASTVRSPRPSVIYSSKDETNSQLQKLQRHVARVLKGLSPSPEVKKGAYNPEILTTQKRQWARFQLQTLICQDQKLVKEPSRIFESLVVIGLHPNADVRAIEKVALERKNGGKKISTNLLKDEDEVGADVNFEPQVLFVYPPDKPLPLKYRDLLSFCFPGGLEVHAIERSPSLSELNEILLGQEHIKQSELSFVFRLQVADDSSLYGCCVLVEEVVQKPSGLISMLSEEKPFFSPLSRYIITTSRCYCILSRLPFFDLHFGILRSIFTEERLQRLQKGIDMLCLESPECLEEDENGNSIDERSYSSEQMSPVHQDCNGILSSNGATEAMIDPENLIAEDKPDSTIQNDHNYLAAEETPKKQSEKHLPGAVLPMLRYNHYESSEPSSSLQGSPSEERSFRSSPSELELEEPSSSGHEDSNDHDDILEWAKANGHGSLQIVCEYYRLRCPARGSTLTFQPLEHLHPVKFHRPGETVLHIAGSSIDLRSCSTSLEVSEAHNALVAEEEATALSVWAVSSICGCLRLENVLTMFAGALLEKQIVIVSSNLGMLSASVLSIIPLIRPYQWQSLLIPVLPNDMLDFLDAPVPYIVGIKEKTAEVQAKLYNTILVDANKNQVKSPSMPQLPQYKELLSSLNPYHAKLVGESYLARKRPVFECTDVQIEAAKGFLAVLRAYLDSLCSNLRSHTITNVQSNDDKVSLLLKESFIDSFPSRDRAFLKLLLDTQLFSVHTDLVLSFYQKD